MRFLKEGSSCTFPKNFKNRIFLYNLKYINEVYYFRECLLDGNLYLHFNNDMIQSDLVTIKIA